VKLCREVDELWGEAVSDCVELPEVDADPETLPNVPVATGLPELARLLEAAEEGEAAAVGVCPDRELCGEAVRDCVVELETDTEAVGLPSGVTLPIGLPEPVMVLEASEEADKAPVKLCRELEELKGEAVSD